MIDRPRLRVWENFGLGRALSYWQWHGYYSSMAMALPLRKRETEIARLKITIKIDDLITN